MSIKTLSPAVLNSSSPQCLRSNVLPGAKAVRTGCEDQYYLTVMYLKNYFLNNSTANRTYPQVWLHFFFLNFPCFYVGKICLITQVMHRHILGVKYPKNTAADKEGRKIPLGFLLQTWSPSSLISASNTVNSMACLFQTFPMYLHTYVYMYKYA